MHRSGLQSCIHFFAFLALATLPGCNDTVATSIPSTFDVPELKQFDSFQLRAIRAADAESDYEAVMESKIRLRNMFGGDWPRDDFSLAENRTDLDEHERAFEQRESFTYSIVSTDGRRVLGCVYLVPEKDTKANVLFWVRESALGTHPESLIRRELEGWLKNDWPIEFEFHAANKSK